MSLCVLTILSCALVLSSVVAAAQESPKQTDKKNIHERAQGLPYTCSQSDVAKYGNPVIFRRSDGLAFGVSTKQDVVRKNEPLVVNIWLLNESADNFYYGLCCESTFLDWIDVLDASGHRLPNSGEVKGSKRGIESVRVCTCSEAIHPHLPGFCGVIDSGTLNRPDTAYNLPPGKYSVTEAESGTPFSYKPGTSVTKSASLAIVVTD